MCTTEIGRLALKYKDLASKVCCAPCLTVINSLHCLLHTHNVNVKA